VGDQMSAYEKKTRFLFPDKGAAFAVLGKKMIEICGSQNKAIEKCGVSKTTFLNLMSHNKITESQAKKILAAYKEAKEIK
jgi:hypothetical protein